MTNMWQDIQYIWNLFSVISESVKTFPVKLYQSILEINEFVQPALAYLYLIFKQIA